MRGLGSGAGQSMHPARVLKRTVFSPTAGISCLVSSFCLSSSFLDFVLVVFNVTVGVVVPGGLTAFLYYHPLDGVSHGVWPMALTCFTIMS